jgi:hypothetical protein
MTDTPPASRHDQLATATPGAAWVAGFLAKAIIQRLAEDTGIENPTQQDAGVSQPGP